MKTEKQLYQWDVGQKLIECAGLYVDFPIGEDIYRVETADGTCIIPDELLQKSSVHKIYECMADNTLREFVFNVKSRPKPPDYVYTPTERLTFEGLVQRVDDAVADIVRRADSGEFDGYTPVKGTDYFTTAEIQQIQNEVSSGAIGEFKSVVDTETETFNTNAESKLTTYNENDVAKTGAYNTNASNKVTEYNSNAENKTAEFDTHTEQIQADVNKLKSDLAELVGGFKTDMFQKGYYSSNGGFETVVTNSNFTSEIISNTFMLNGTIEIDNGYGINFAYFENGVFHHRDTWSYGTKEFVKNGYDVAIMIATQDKSDYALDELLAHYSFGEVLPNFNSVVENLNSAEKRIESVEKSMGSMGRSPDYINKIVCSDTGRNIIHFSVDDTWMCIKDITDNEYSSIFTNSFLGKLKELHDNYGICVTLNTFNTVSTDASYNIANVPTRYQAEFQANKSWLKFAFHAESDVENYNTSTGISTSYDTFVNAIYNLTGDYDCIDRVARLGYFGGSLENVLAIKNKEHGIIGLLCADDTRISYYLTEEQNGIVQRKGKYIDVDNELFMIKTITRNTANMISEIENNLCYQKFVEIFMHEYEGNPTFETVAEWAKNNGYVSAFPSVLLN